MCATPGHGDVLPFIDNVIMPRDGERDRSKGGRAHTHSREERRAAVRRVSIDN